MSDVKSKLMRNLTRLKEIEANLQEATDSIKCAKSNVDTQNMLIIARINQAFTEFHDMIEQHKQSLLERVSSVAKEKCNQLCSQAKNFTISLHTL